MDLVPRKPFRDELSTFRKEMDSLWNRFFGESRFPSVFGEKWLPTSDISETADSVSIKAELPGLEAKDIEVTISGDVRTIKGEKKKEEEKSSEQYHYTERYYGSFQRSYQLPATVQTDKVDASFEKGVLKISLPKTEESKAKEIKIPVK